MQENRLINNINKDLLDLIIIRASYTEQGESPSLLKATKFQKQTDISSVLTGLCWTVKELLASSCPLIPVH